MEPLGLPVGTARTACFRTFVPIETQPPEIALDGRLGVLRGALDVGVFDAQHERTARAAREQPVE